MNLFIVSIFLLWCLFLGFIELKKIKLPKTIWWLNVILFAFICCTRDTNVPDTSEYIKFYNNISLYFSSWITNNDTEIGYSILMGIIKSLNLNYQSFFFIIVIINFFVLNKTINECKEYFKIDHNIHYIFFILYLSFYGIYYNAMVLRAGIAISFCLYSIFLLLNKKYIVGMIMVLLSNIFHNSAIVAFLIILFAFILPGFKRKFYRKYILFILIIYLIGINNIIFYNIIDVLQDFVVSNNMGRIYQSYIFKDNNFGIAFKVLYYFLIGLYITFINENIFLKMKKLINVYCIGLTLSILFSSITAFSRLTDFFFIFYIFILINAYFKANKENYKINIFDFILFVFITMINYSIVNTIEDVFY